MAIINLTELYDHIMPHVPGVSTPIVNHHLNDIARLFCRKTRAWNFLTGPLDLEAGVAQVDTEALISSAATGIGAGSVVSRRLAATPDRRDISIPQQG